MSSKQSDYPEFNAILVYIVYWFVVAFNVIKWCAMDVDWNAINIMNCLKCLYANSSHAVVTEVDMIFSMTESKSLLLIYLILISIQLQTSCSIVNSTHVLNISFFPWNTMSTHIFQNRMVYDNEYALLHCYG